MRLPKHKVLQMLAEIKRNERQVYQALKDFKGLTKHEMAHLLNIPPHRVQNVLYLLQTKGRIHKVDVWRNRREAKYKLFQWHAGKRLYFIDRERLRQWVLMQVPPHEKTSKRFWSILRNRVRKNFDVNLEA